MSDYMPVDQSIRFHEDVDMLRASLEHPMSSTEAAVENAVAVYQAAKVLVDEAKKLQDAAKARLAEIVVVTAPSVSVRWDSKALDALMASSDENARLLSPFRTESERAGTLRITAAK